MIALASLFLAATASAAEPAQQVVLLVDQSGSMKKATLAAEIEKARLRADAILCELGSGAGTGVSFWTFGERDRQAEIASDLSPAAARARLGEILSPDPTRYSQNRTYIAYSIFQIVKSELGLPADFDTDDDIPGDRTRFTLLVYTDGDESPEPGFDNDKYVRWLARQVGKLQVDWRVWTLYGNNAAFGPEQGQVTYDVLFGAPTDAYNYNPAGATPAGDGVSVAVPPEIRLVPRLLRGRPTQAETVTNGYSVCPAQPPPLTTPAASPAAEIRAQARVAWPGDGAIAGGATGGWTLHAPARDMGSPDCGAAGISQSTLAVTPPDDPRVVIPDLRVADGEYPLGYDVNSLCAALTSNYPNSSFVFSGSAGHIGTFHVQTRKEYVVHLQGADGSAPTAAMAPIEEDIFGRFAPSTRLLVATIPEGSSDSIDFNTTLTHDGNAVVGSAGLLGLRTERARGGSITTKSAETVTVSAPTDAPDWLDALPGIGMSPAAGAYEALVCVKPGVVSTTDAAVSIVCDGECDASRIVRTRDSLCVRIPVEVRHRMLNVWSFIAWATALFLIGGFAWRVWTRSFFPKGLTIGNLEKYRDLQTGYKKSFWTTFLRRPAFIDLYPLERTQLTTLDPRHGKKKAGGMRTVIAVRPSPTGSSRMLLWCAALPDPDVERAEVSVDGLPLLQTERDARAIAYADVRNGNIRIRVTRTRGGVAVGEPEQFLIQFRT